MFDIHSYTGDLVVWCPECNEECVDSRDASLPNHTSKHRHKPSCWNGSPNHIHMPRYKDCILPFDHPECKQKDD